MMCLSSVLVLAALDLGALFSSPEAWKQSSVDFAVDHQGEGFTFASQKRDIVNCLKPDACTWHGLKVWETKVYYGAEGAKRVELSLYNRGDDKSGLGLDAAGFGQIADAVASYAGKNAKPSADERRKLKKGGFLTTRRWTESDPMMALAWGQRSTKKGEESYEFVRLTLAPKPAKQVKKGATKTVAGNVAKAKVKEHVRKNSDGDVWIDGVPMVDQGQKGYCAAAVAERVLRYYGNQVDEHEVAQAAGTTSGGGTSVAEMKDAVKAIASKYRLGYNEIVTIIGSFKDVEKEVAQYNKAAKAAKEKELVFANYMHGNMFDVSALKKDMRPKVVKAMRLKDSRYKKFLKDVKTQVDAGVPVIWGVSLGVFPEPGIPQNAGGHMRLIIGYNAKTKEILFSDTWGSGHELKRMPEDWAFAITHDAFFLRPL